MRLPTDEVPTIELPTDVFSVLKVWAARCARYPHHQNTLRAILAYALMCLLPMPICQNLLSAPSASATAPQQKKLYHPDTTRQHTTHWPNVDRSLKSANQKIVLAPTKMSALVVLGHCNAFSRPNGVEWGWSWGLGNNFELCGSF